jgi:hypothetical protein
MTSSVVVVVTYEIIRLSVAWYWNCYSTLHLADGAEKLVTALSGAPSWMLPDATEKRYM